MTDFIIRVGRRRDRATDDSHTMTDATTPRTASNRTPDDLAIENADGETEAIEYVHEDDEYCARETDGRVVVGVTNDGGEVLLNVDADGEHAILPNCHVEDGDWRGVARETVEGSTGIAVTLDGIRAVRAVDHRLEGDDEPRERTYHVVFAASPAAVDDGTAPEPSCDDPEWTAGWYDELPVEIDDEHGDARADIERFLP